MGISTRPVQRWEILQAAGIWIRDGGKGLMIEMEVDRAARLVKSLRGVETVDTEISLADYFLEEITHVGKRARRAEKSNS